MLRAPAVVVLLRSGLLVGLGQLGVVALTALVLGSEPLGHPFVALRPIHALVFIIRASDCQASQIGIRTPQPSAPGGSRRRGSGLDRCARRGEGLLVGGRCVGTDRRCRVCVDGGRVRGRYAMTCSGTRKAEGSGRVPGPSSFSPSRGPPVGLRSARRPSHEFEFERPNLQATSSDLDEPSSFLISGG